MRRDNPPAPVARGAGRRTRDVPVSDLDYVYFERRVRERTGIDLTAYKPEQMRRRLGSLMRRSNAGSFVEYFHVIDSQPERMKEFEDFFTINVSEFYRGPEKFEHLRTAVLPR
ncbi:MAG: hypothetical protein ACYDAG_15870, partial [Chloroflexota bacterium]